MTGSSRIKMGKFSRRGNCMAAGYQRPIPFVPQVVTAPTAGVELFFHSGVMTNA
jgi:hypothetical protein